MCALPTLASGRFMSLEVMGFIRPSHAEISVIIQGPLHRNHRDGDLALKCIQSIREHLPGAEIIISTWVGEDLSDLDFDKLKFNDDPGPVTSATGNQSNINRQIVSTHEGLLLSQRKFGLKLRADCTLNGPDLCKIFTTPQSLQHLSFFNSPITTTNLFVPSDKGKLLFHPSDIVQFGTMVDLRTFWSRDLFRTEDIYFPVRIEVPIGFRKYLSPVALRKYADEQALFLRLARKKNLEINLSSAASRAPRLIQVSKMLLAANFSVIDHEASGVSFPQRFLNDPYVLAHRIVSRQEFLKFGERPKIDTRFFRMMVWEYLTFVKHKMSIVRIANLFVVHFRSPNPNKSHGN